MLLTFNQECPDFRNTFIYLSVSANIVIIFIEKYTLL